MAPSRSVLVTGCSTGIGRATAERLARSGRTVYATARRPETLDELAKAGCHVLPLDVTDETSMVEAVRTVEARDGAVGVLVNNAGYAQEGPVEEVALDDARRQFETNVFGLARLTQLVLPGMRAQRWGRVVNVSSMGGKLTLPGGGWYHASKYAVEALSDALRFETKGFGVHVIVVEPGPVKTKFGDTLLAELGPPDGPYARFNEVMAKRVTQAYDGVLSVFAVPPERVAKVIERAVTASRPRSRYRVTVAARTLLALRKVMPDAAWDVFARTQFPQPK
jgi:NAD(P)-dependent dehydrogenase (short-subunit alcohol dehydrogenase family)